MTPDDAQGVLPAAFRDALGRFASGVAVLTAVAADGRAVGLTITALSSLSLQPPLILFCLDDGTTDLAAYAEGAVVANLLSEEQRELSDLFASQRAEKFAAVDYEWDERGCPVLRGCLANLHCQVVAVHPGGDHQIIVARVDRTHTEHRRPLIYFRGRYAGLGAFA